MWVKKANGMEVKKANATNGYLRENAHEAMYVHTSTRSTNKDHNEDALPRQAKAKEKEKASKE